jgi:drug/metabolite transporter (DMT)-like permease
MGATTYLVPALAVLMGWSLLGEAPPALALVGGTLWLAGVAVTREARWPRRRATRRLAEAEAGTPRRVTRP